MILLMLKETMENFTIVVLSLLGIIFFVAFIYNFCLGIFPSRSKSKLFTPDIYSENVKEVNKNVTQIAPYYHGYRGGFSSITICNTCGRTALREDQHPVDPCSECGGKILDSGAAKWNGKQWIILTSP